MTRVFKKIEVLATNNGTFAFQDSSFVLGKPLSEKYLLSLRKYIEKRGFSPGKGKELEFIKKALKWSSSQWKHDGMNQPPQGSTALDILKNVYTKNKRYRCVEYGQVLAELLQSYGFIARIVGLRSKDVAYGGQSRGHVAVEVWSNDLKKWLFLDPQFGAFLTYKDSILNVYEIYKLKSQKRWNQLKVESTYLSVIKKQEYKKILRNYLGFMGVGNISLFLEMKKTVLTFQGQPSQVGVYTNNPGEVYPQINRVTLKLSFKQDNRVDGNFFKELKIKTEDDYLTQMHKFAAVPDFKVSLKNNMPLFSFYEYRTTKTGSWKKIKKDTFDWVATKASNHLEVRAVNRFRRHGPTTFISLSYRL